MERIKIEIEKLGRIANSTIEIAPLMIFSGESGMGKSYLALLSHYFFDILILSERDPRLPHLFDALGHDYHEMTFRGEGEVFTITKSDLENWMETDAVNYLRFMLNQNNLEGRIKITLPSSVPEQITFRFKEEMTGLLNSEDVDIILSIDNIGYRVSHSAINDETPYASVLSAYLIKCLFGNILALRSTFNMPPSRGPVLSENVLGNSGMYKDFIADVIDLSNVQSTPREFSEALNHQLYDIMEGEVKKEDNRFVYYYTKDHSIPVSAAAASIREIAPLQLLANKWDISKTGILIEEPEAHLHPTKQRMMADVIGCIRKAGAYVHLTTHSDYFLRRINELILFQRYADSHDEKSVKDLSMRTGISPTCGIDSNDVVAYYVERQSDNTSKIIEQDMKDGIPFTAFDSAVMESLRVNDILEEVLDR